MYRTGLDLMNIVCIQKVWLYRTPSAHKCELKSLRYTLLRRTYSAVVCYGLKRPCCFDREASRRPTARVRILSLDRMEG